jgi:ATP-dependent helicase/nuclease subunit B
MIERLVDVLDKGGLVLTVTQRLAHHLHERHANRMRDVGARTWATPSILPLDAWIHATHAALLEARLLDAKGEHPTVLSREQEQLLWEDCVQSVMDDRGVNLRRAAAAAADTYTLTRRWRITLDPRTDGRREDTAVFLRAKDVFERRCQAAAWLPSAGILDDLLLTIEAGSMAIPRDVAFVGFTIRRPEVTRLAEALRCAGCRVSEIAFAGSDGPCERRAFASAEDEALAAAQWAGERLASSDTDVIGIVAPDVSAHRELLERAFTDVLEPDRYFDERRGTASVVEISLGVPLSRVPVVRHALLFLELLRDSFSSDIVSAILRSPFLTDAEAERFDRARLDATLRERAPATLTRGAVVTHATLFNSQDGTSTVVAPGMISMLNALDGMEHSRTPAGWVRSFEAALKICGWPGERTASSEEFQAVQSWKQTLARFAQLNMVRATLTLEEALLRLRDAATQTVFHARQEGARVQIVGLLEAAGLAFDHLWIMNMHAGAWPHAAPLDPLIPATVQIAAGLPFASAASAVDISATLLRQAIASSRTTPVISYPVMDGDQSLPPSPLVPFSESSPILRAERSALYTSIIAADGRRDTASSPFMEELEDSIGPSLMQGEDYRGGTRILEDQAACPFRGFAVARLGSSPLGVPEPGLTTRQQGTIIHHALMEFWTVTQSRDALLRMSDKECAALVSHAVETAMRAHARDAQLDPAAAIERERARALLSDWLDVERARGAFTIAPGELEQALTIQCGPLSLRTRIDRIDRLADGRVVLVDYKTGDVSVNGWRDERPENCQLLLYATGIPEAVSAIAFAQLKAGKLGYHGVGDGDTGIPGVLSLERFSRKDPGAPASWEAQLGLWRERLNALAEEFASGLAVVRPRRPSSCEHCGEQPLCRVHDTVRAAGASDEGEGEEVHDG